MAEVVRLKFGVLGGGSVAAGSGAEILRDLKSIVSQIESSGITKLKFKIDTSNISKDIQKQMSMGGSNGNKLSTEIRQNNAEWKSLERQMIKVNNFDWNNLKNQYKTQQAAIKQKDKAQADTIKTSERAINTETQNIKVLNQAVRTYEKYERSIKRVSKEKGLSLDDDFKSFIGKMQANPEYANTLEARNELAKLEKAMLEAGATSETTSEKLKRLFDAHFSTAIAMVGVHLLQQSLREIINTVKELDSAIVDLQIATGYSRDRTRELVADYSELGKQIGATTAQVAQAADGWLRQGYSVEQANTLIKNSMMLSKLGQIDSEQATTALTSAMKGYNLSVEESIGVVDRFVSVDMQAAVSAGDIAIAMSETATGARLAGVDMDRLAGYIATVAEVTQDGAESVGVFYKTLFARMGNIKAGNLIDPESAESLSDVESSLSGVGIKLRDSNSEFRNFGDVLDEVAGRWNEFSEVEQKALAVAFSGKRIA